MQKDYSIYKKPKKEKDRLDLQIKNGSRFTKNVIDQAFSGLGDDLIVFDFGCFNGNSTKTFFEDYEERCRRIIGLDFVESAIKEANKDTRNGKYKFMFADLEASNLRKTLKECLKEEGKKTIDVVFISYVLLHLKNPQKLLKTISKFSNNQTVIIIKDTEDSLKVCHPHNEILQEEIEVYSKIREMSRFSDRYIGRKIPSMLRKAGFNKIKCFNSQGTTLGKSLQERRDLYKVLFSFRERPQFPERKVNAKEFQRLCTRNTHLLKKLKALFEKEDFYYVQFTFIFVAKKVKK